MMPFEPTTPKATEEETEDGRSLLTLAAYDSAVEQIIRDAQEEGKFDNLPGEGKPLLLDENMYAGDQELAYKLLKDNGYTLPWIADRNDMLERIKQFRDKIERQWQLHGLVLMGAAEQSQTPPLRWYAIRSQWEAQIADLNGRIDDVNLSIPVEALRIYRLVMSVELLRLGVPAAWETN